TDKGETIDYFYRCGTQLELEEALASWLRKQIRCIEEQHESAREAKQSSSTSNGLDRLRQQQWLAFAGNLYSLATLHCESHNFAANGRRLEVGTFFKDGRTSSEPGRCRRQDVPYESKR